VNKIHKYLAHIKFFYGWIVVIGCFISSASYGLFYSLGIFFKSFQHEFGWSAGLISSIHSFHLMVFVVAVPFMGRMADRYGIRKIFSLCAVLGGMGFILCSTVQALWHFYLFYAIATLGVAVATALPTSIVQKWFVKKKGLALGIVSSGIGAGPIIVAPTVNYLVSRFGWRVSYLIIGGTALIILLIIAQVLIDRPEDIGLRPLGEEQFDANMETELENKGSTTLSKEEWSTRDAIKSKAFILLGIIWMLSALPVHMIMIHIVPYAIDMGVSRGAAAAALGLIGGFSIGGRLLGGTFADRWGWVKTLIIAAFVSTIAILWLLIVKNYFMLLVFVVMYGFSYGARVPQIPGLVGTYFGTKNLTEILGVTWAIAGFGGMLGPLVGGLVFDITGSYTNAFVFASACFGLTGVLAVFLKKPQLTRGSQD